MRRTSSHRSPKAASPTVLRRAQAHSSVAKRYQPQTLNAEQGGVQTFAGRDALNGLPVRMYTFMGEPTARVGELSSPYLPPVLSSSFVDGAGEVIVAFADEFRPLKGAVAPGQVEILLRQSAAALDDAARAGVVHGDLSPERVLFDREAGTGGRFLLEGYGVPWRVKPSEFSAPERISGPSFAADLFSWARTVTHLSGPLPGDLRDLLARCLDADPAARPRAREVRAALDGYSFGGRAPQVNLQAARDVSAFDDFGGDFDDDADDFAGPVLLAPTEAGDATSPADQAVTDPKAVGQGAVDPLPVVKVFTAPARGLEAAPEGADTPSPTLWTLPRTETPHELPADSLRLTDHTTAYRARRAQYDAERARSAPAPDDARSPSKPPTPEPFAPRSADVKPVAPGTSETSATRPGVRVRPLVRPPGDDFQSTADDQNTFHEPDDFEVVDDIDDRAPDPTLNRGGRRVLLLTLLVIAALVLLALQFV